MHAHRQFLLTPPPASAVPFHLARRPSPSQRIPDAPRHTARAFPPSSITMMTRRQQRSLDRKAFGQFRSNVGVMASIYSFLPLTDRVRLGEVDKDFLHDEQRGCIEGVYGDGNESNEKALLTVREYLEYEGTPDSLTVFMNEPDCWFWTYEHGFEGDTLSSRLKSDWFHKDSGYDIKKMVESGAFSKSFDCYYDKDSNTEEIFHAVRDGFGYVNCVIEKNREALAKLEADVEALLPSARYNALIELMEKHDIETYRFLHAEQPPMYGFSDHSYMIEEGGCGSYLQHIRPGRRLSYRDGDGKRLEKVIKACGRCKKLKDDVRSEYCGRKHCGDSESVCGDCSSIRKCSTCGGLRCVCSFSGCSFPDC